MTDAGQGDRDGKKAMTSATSIIAIALSLVMGGSAQAAENDSEPGLKDHPTPVHFEWEPRDRTVTITFHTGCRSAHGSPALEEMFEVYLDRDYLQFDIQGGYREKPQDDTAGSTRPNVGPADCMGSISKSIELLYVEPEEYVVNRNGYLVQTVTLGDRELSFDIPATGARKPGRSS